MIQGAEIAIGCLPELHRKSVSGDITHFGQKIWRHLTDAYREASSLRAGSHRVGRYS